ncbi:hypothetical protein PJN21_29885, partial [Mycobacterium kansasii]
LSGDTGLVDPHPAESSRSVLRALAYGWTADELAAMLKTSPGDAKHLVLQYLSETLLDQLTGAIAAARELGYAATLSGR